MFSTLTAKNQYGGYTHEIKIMPIFIIRLIEMNQTSINVQFIEKKILRSDKIHFAFLNTGSIVDAVIAAFGEIKYPTRHDQEIEFDIEDIDSIQDDVMDLLVRKSDVLKEKSIITKQGV
jgi:hypothetical protein